MCFSRASTGLKSFLNLLPRMTLWLLLSLVLFGLAMYVASAHPGSLLAVSLYKVHMVSIAGWCGYWLDRALFPYARPHTFVHDDQDQQIHGSPAVASVDFSDTGLELIDGGIVSHMAGLVMLRRALIALGALIAIGLGA